MDPRFASPWTAKLIGKHWKVLSARSAEVCKIGCTRDEEAHLLAASPEMLHCLEMVRDADDDCARDNKPRIPIIARYRIDQAIKKARGQK